MNKGHLVQSASPVQQMMAAGNPNWCWNLSNNISNSRTSSISSSSNHQFEHHGHQQPPQIMIPPSSFSFPHDLQPSNTTNNNLLAQDQLLMNIPTSSSLPFLSSSCWPDNTQLAEQHPAEAWSQLLMGAGLVLNGEEQKAVAGLMNQFQHQEKKIENWEDQVINLGGGGGHHHQHQQSSSSSPVDHVKQENSPSATTYRVYDDNNNNTASTHEEFQGAHHVQQINSSAAHHANWSSSNPHNHQMMPVSSPQSSCVTSFNNNMLDFSSPKSDARHPPPPPSDRSSECISSANTTRTGGATKKAKAMPSSSSSTQPPFKVRKEKLGDRITALHQLVSPFGKTDTASVLLEAIGYIRFLQSQIEALSLPYLSSGNNSTTSTHGSGNNKRQQQQMPQPTATVQGERNLNSIFPEDPGQLLNEHCLKRKGGPDKDAQEEPKDLRSRGLCLVPISCTLHVGSDNGADYWAPAAAVGACFR